MSKFSKIAIVAVFAVIAFAGVKANAAYVHTTTLKMGSTGSQVMSLQQTLNGGGFLVATTGAGSPGMESMYFGSLTKASVMAFQAAKGLTSDGIVGINTGTALSAMTDGSTMVYSAGCSAGTAYSVTTGLPCTTATSTVAGCTAGAMFSSTTGASCTGGTTPTTSGVLEGGAGSITVDSLSDFSNEEVGEDEEDVEVLAFEVEADNDSDVEITSIKVEFVQSAASVSDNFDDYAESVSIWLDGEMVGESDLSDFSESSDIWTESISLDGAIIDAGETMDFTVAVTALNNLDSGDIGTDAWTADVLNVRFEDAEGVVTTEDTDSDALEQSFDFASFATATDTEFKITNGDDAINDAHVIDVDATDNTDDVEILSFNVEIEGESDVTLDSLPVNITVAGGQDNVDEMISGISLWLDGSEVGSVTMTTDCVEELLANANCTTVGTAETYFFEDMDITLDAGSSNDFTVAVDFYGVTDTGDLAAGNTILAVFGETQTELASFDAIDESGEDLADGDKTGTVTGEASAVYDVGIMVELVSVEESAVVQAEIENTTDSVTLTIKFDVTSFGSDIYVDGTVTEDGDGTYANGSGVNFFSTRADTGADATALTTIAAALTSTDADSAANVTWLVQEGDTDTFTFTATMSNTLTDDAANDELLFQLALMSIGYDTTAIAATTNSYTFNLSDFESDPVSLGELDAA